MYINEYIMKSSGFEEEDSNLSHIKVDEILGFMGNIRSKISSDNTMPCWVIFFVKLFLDESSNILKLNELLFQC